MPLPINIQDLLQPFLPGAGAPAPTPGARPGIHSFLQGYPGPFPGTPEFRAALQAGQHPIMDWLRQQRAANGQAPRPPRPEHGPMPGGPGGPGPTVAIGEPLGEPPHPMMAASAGASLPPLGGDERRRPIPLVAQRRRPDVLTPR